MDFKEFYKLLDVAITKEKSDISPSKENFDSFLFNRYLSFYHPEIAVFIAKTSNRTGWIVDSEDPDMTFLCIKSIFPKLPKKFIEYIKKPVTDKLKELNVKDEEIYLESKLHECSKREILDLIDYERRTKR